MAIPFWFNVDIQRVSGTHAEWPSLFCCSVFDIQRESGSQPNGHPSLFVQRLMFSGCRAVRPNGYFLFLVQLSHAEWPLFTVQCFNVQCLMPSQFPLLLPFFVFHCY